MSKGYCDYCKKLKPVEIDKVFNKCPDTKTILFICKDCKKVRKNEGKSTNSNSR